MMKVAAPTPYAAAKQAGAPMLNDSLAAVVHSIKYNVNVTVH